MRNDRITYVLVSEFLFDLRRADQRAVNATDTSHPSFVDPHGGHSLHFAGGLEEFGNEVNHSFMANPTGTWSDTDNDRATQELDGEDHNDEEETSSPTSTAAQGVEQQVDDMQPLPRTASGVDGQARLQAGPSQLV